MIGPYEANMNGARLARQLAADCLEEAKTSSPARARYLVGESDRHIARAEIYENYAKPVEKAA